VADFGVGAIANQQRRVLLVQPFQDVAHRSRARPGLTFSGVKQTAILESVLQRGARLTVKDGDFMFIVGEKMSRVDFEGPCTKQQTLICLPLLRAAGQRNMNTRRTSRIQATIYPGTQYERKLAQLCSFGLRCVPTAESPIIEGKNANEGRFYRCR